MGTTAKYDLRDYGFTTLWDLEKLRKCLETFTSTFIQDACTGLQEEPACSGPLCLYSGEGTEITSVHSVQPRGRWLD